MENKNILISGAGIAGLTLAYWLKKYGFNPTVVEHSPVLREGGYMIDFFGAGYHVAEKMKIISAIEKEDIKIAEITFVDENNKKEGGLNAAKIRKLMNNKAVNLLRSDLSRVIYNSLDKDIPFIFGDSISKIEQTASEVNVTFKSGKEQQFDLVVGADGLHSNVRHLVFGPESQFEKYYGYYTSSYTVENYFKKDNQFLSYTVPGRQVGIYSLKNNKLATFFLFTSPEKITYEHHDVNRQKQILRDAFKEMKWECDTLLSKMDTAPDFYFDTVSQIQMTQWAKNRVTLVGDACDCPSLLSGQGSTLAMVGAYILAGELNEAKGNYNVAFNQYQQIFKPFIDNKQKIAQNFAESFLPKNKFGIWVRNTFTNLMFLPFVSNWLVKQFMIDKIKLKDYDEIRSN
ncbi:MAG TPA: FAD-dependent monooxygenase [Bacteroidia bacterium]|nr:FAD-dependent monooxygenase [Bacteroidia bacterium]